MNELTKEEMLILEYCEEIGMSIEESTLMLLIWEDATNDQKHRILNELDFVENKYHLLDVFLNNTDNID